jgi:hypothetical protein
MRVKPAVVMIRKTVRYLDFAVLFKTFEYRKERIASKLEMH